MNTQHANSHCCQASIRRFGGRRRQCSRCRKTWTIRPKRRGRHRIRLSTKIFSQIFEERFILRHLALRRSRVSLPSFRYRFRQALRRFVARPGVQKIPAGPLILLADGLRFQFRGRTWVLYLTAVKACAGTTATFLDPVLLPGQEGAFRWQQVFNSIPLGIRQRIRALVVDNLNGMAKLSKQHGWRLQLCHFHLLRKLQVQWKRPQRALKGGYVREEIYQLIRRILDVPDGSQLQGSLSRLTKIARSDCGTQRIRSTVLYFLQSMHLYRTYQTHPELNLPATTNAAESMASIIRDLLRRTRAASNPQALFRWSKALLRMHPTIVCNRKYQQN